MKHMLTGIFALTLLAACGRSDDVAATGFITPGYSVPASARTETGDVPRDADGRPFTYGLLGETLPAVSGTRMDGSTFSTADLAGQWTVIDVWGLWCSDCMADAPHVAALASAIATDAGLNFLSVHTPPNASRADEAFGSYGSVETFFDEKGYSYPTVIDRDASIRDAFEIEWTPTYLLVAPDLTVQGFRSDLSAAGGEPVKDFLKDIADVKQAYAGE